MRFDSFQELERLDLAYGGQLDACKRLAARSPRHTNAFAWGDVPTRGALALGFGTMAERVAAMDIVDLLTKFSGLR